MMVTYLQSERMGTVLRDGQEVNAALECQNFAVLLERAREDFDVVNAGLGDQLSENEQLRQELKALRKGHTITVEYDLSPAMVESALRDKLIELGWTSPPEQEGPTQDQIDRAIQTIEKLGAPDEQA